MLAPVTHILPLTTFRRERLLPVPGRITVRLEQKVNPLDVVAETSVASEHLLIDVAGRLGLRPDVAQGLIKVYVGETIPKGRVLAQRAGYFHHDILAPSSGRVITVEAGKILMEVRMDTIELRAGIPGIVTRTLSNRGVEIKFKGALVQGIWGNGRMDFGLMIPMHFLPGESLVPRQLVGSLRGSVLLAGTCSDPAALQTANDLLVRGMILGSMSPVLIPLACRVNYPIIVMDGFGQQPMNSAAFKLLTAHARRETTLNAEPFDRQAGVRPEVYIPLTVPLEPPEPIDVESFAPGQAVRLTRAPHAGEVGTLVGLRPGLVSMPSGLRVAAAEVRLDSGEQILLPLANLEVLR